MTRNPEWLISLDSRSPASRSSEMTPDSHPRQRAGEAVEHFVELRLGDDERRAEGDEVADRADDEPFLLAELGEPRPVCARRLEGRLRALVGHELERADKAL